jgi:glyoxylase-like metal-dependent hydrolase (beta-lactamase superfamily II)
MQNTPIAIELPTIFGMKTVNSFLFKHPEPILIDCGENTPESWDALNKGLSENGLQLSDIKKIYITHMHIDHVGMAGRIAQEFGTEIWVNEKSARRVREYIEFSKVTKKFTIDITSKLFGVDPNDTGFNPMFTSEKSTGRTRDTWTGIPEEHMKVYNIGDSLNLGTEKWDVIYMPGHSDTQVIYHQKESKKILSADMLLSVTPTPFYELTDETKGDRVKGLPIMMNSYAQLNALDFDIAYPGHYTTITNPKEIIHKQVEHIHKRKLQCLELIKGGDRAYFKLYPKMYDKFTITAVTMLVGYLDLLVEEEKIRWIEDEKRIRFEMI